MNRLGYTPEFNESNDSDSTINNPLSDEAFRQESRSRLGVQSNNTPTLSDDEFRSQVRKSMVPEEDRGNYMTSGDIVRDVSVGIYEAEVAAARNALELSGIVSGGHIPKFVEDNIGALPTSEQFDKSYSKTTQDQNKALQSGMGDDQFDNFITTIKNTPENPAAVARTLLTSMGSMAAGGAYGRALKGVGAGVKLAAAMGEGIAMAAETAGNIRRQNDDNLLSGGDYPEITGVGVGGAVIGKLGGKLADKLGAANIDELMTGGITEAVSNSVKRTLTSGAIESLEELGQSGLETVLLNHAVGKPLTQGLGHAMALGAVAGGVMGAGSSFATIGNQVDDKGKPLNLKTNEPYENSKVSKTVSNINNINKRKKVVEKRDGSVDKLNAQLAENKAYLKGLKNEEDPLLNREIDEAIENISLQEEYANLEATFTKDLNEELVIAKTIQVRNTDITEEDAQEMARNIIKKEGSSEDPASIIEMINQEVLLQDGNDSYYDRDTQEVLEELQEPSQEPLEDTDTITPEEEIEVSEANQLPEDEVIEIGEAVEPPAEFTEPFEEQEEIEIQDAVQRPTETITPLEDENISPEELDDLQTSNEGVISDEDLVSEPTVPEGFEEEVTPISPQEVSEVRQDETSTVPTEVLEQSLETTLSSPESSTSDQIGANEELEVIRDEVIPESPEVTAKVDVTLSKMDRLNERLEKINQKDELTDRDYDTIEDIESQMETLRSEGASSVTHKPAKKVSQEETDYGDSSRQDYHEEDIDDDLSFSFSEKNKISSFNDSFRDPTLKVFENIFTNSKAKNKSMFVRQKLKEVKATKSETEVVEDTLSVLDPEGKGKYTWEEFVSAVSAKISPMTSSNTEEHSYADYGYSHLNYNKDGSGENLLDLSDALSNMVSEAIAEADVDDGRVEIVIRDNANTVETRLIEELNIFDNYHSVNIEQSSDYASSYSVENDAIPDLIESMNLFFEQMSNDYKDEGLDAYFTEYNLKNLDKDIPLSFPKVKSARDHDIANDSVGFVRSFIRENKAYIAEIQSDVAQMNNDELSSVQSMAEGYIDSDTKEQLGNIKYDVDQIVSEHLSKMMESDLDTHIKIKEEVLNVPFRERDDTASLLYSNLLRKSHADLIHDILDKYDHLPYIVYSRLSTKLARERVRVLRGDSKYNNALDLEKDLKDTKAVLHHAVDSIIREGRGYEGKTTFDSLLSPEWQAVKKVVNLRTVREKISELAESGHDSVRVSTVETLTKIEGWEEGHDSLKKKHKVLLEKLGKEFKSKEVTDDSGNTWVELQIPDNYSPLAFSLKDGTSSSDSTTESKNEAISHISSRLNLKSLRTTRDDNILDFSMKSVENASSLSKKLQKKLEGKNPQGLYDETTNTVYIFTDNNSSVDEAVGTVAHELIGHVGLRKVLGKNYDNLLVRMLNSDKSLLNNILGKVHTWSIYQEQWIKKNGQEALDALPDSQKFNSKDVNGEKVVIPFDVALRLADEYMAELARENVFQSNLIEERVGSGKMRKAKRVKRKSLIKTYMKKVKHLLRSVLGKHSDSVSEDDLLEMLAASVDKVFKTTDFDYNKISTLTNKNSLNSKVRAAYFGQKMALEMGAKREAVSAMVRTSLKGDMGSLNKSAHNQFLDKIGRKIRATPYIKEFFADRGIPYSKYLYGIEAQHSGLVRQNEKDTAELYKLTRDLTPAENDELFLFYTTKDATIDNIIFKKNPKDNDRLIELAYKTKEEISEIGSQLVGLGALDSSTYLDNDGSYLQSQYVKYLNQSLGGSKSPSFRNYLKKKDPSLSDLDKAEKGKIKDAGYLVASSLMVMHRDTALHQMYDSIEQASKDNYLGWVLGESDKITSDGKSYTRVKIEDEIDRLTGLVRGHQSAYDHNATSFNNDEFKHIQSRLEFFEGLKEESDTQILNNLTNALQEQLGREPTQTEITKFQTSRYKRMPKSKRYGKLSNQLVLKEVHDSFFSIDAVHKELDSTKYLTEGKVAHYTKIWKSVQVGLNPPSIIRNILGNFFFMDTATNTNAGTTTKNVINIFTDRIKNKENRFIQYALSEGLDTTTLSAHELYSLSNDFKFSIKEEESKNPLTHAFPFIERRFTDVLTKAGDFFGWQESLFKTAVLQDYVERWEKEAIERGDLQKGQIIDDLNPDQKSAVLLQATSEANRALFDYSKVNSAVNVIRNSPLGAPFFTFMYKSFPVMVENTARRPWKMAQYIALPYAISHLTAMMWDWDDDELEEYMSKQALYLKHNKSVMVFPGKDPQGNVQVMDLSATLPHAKFTNGAIEAYDESNFSSFSQGINSIANAAKIGAVDIFGILGTPAFQLGSFITNDTDNFTGKPVRTEGAPAQQQLLESLGFLYNMAFPSWLGTKGSVAKTFSAATGETSFNKDIPKYTPFQAAASYAGMNIKTSIPEDNIAMNEGLFAKKRKAYEAAYRKAYQEGVRKGKDIAVIKNKYKLEGVRLQKEYKKYKDSIK